MLSQIVKSLSAFFIMLMMFSSCNPDEKNREVTSGQAQVKTLVFSRTCLGGSFKVSKQTAPALSSTVSTSGITQLQLGDQVTITGTVNNGQVCGLGSVSFNCQATVRIDTNRAFICSSSGSIGAGSLGVTSSPVAVPGGIVSGTPVTPAYTSIIGGRNVLGGDFYVFDNGTKVSVHITLSGPSINPQAVCKIGFIC